jgi:hypothetical protein
MMLLNMKLYYSQMSLNTINRISKFWFFGETAKFRCRNLKHSSQRISNLSDPPGHAGIEEIWHWEHFQSMLLSKYHFNSRNAQGRLKSQKRETKRKSEGEDNVHHRNSNYSDDLKEKVKQTSMYRALHNSQDGIWLQHLRQQRNRREAWF